MKQPDIRKLNQACQLIEAAYNDHQNPDAVPDSIITRDGEQHRVMYRLNAHPNGRYSTPERFALVTESPDTYRVSIRGTDSFQDWITDSRLQLEPTGFIGQATAGVNDLALQLHNQLAFPTDKPIILQGHSLGAAIATRLAVMGQNIAAVYAIASPKWADAAFAAAYQQRYGDRTIRLVNQADLVPKLPEDFPGLPELHHVVPALAFNADHGDIAARHALATYQNNLWQFA